MDDIVQRLRIRAHNAPSDGDCVAFRIAADEIERLRGIVDRLPKTADGVPVVPGQELWFGPDDGPLVVDRVAFGDVQEVYGDCECYGDPGSSDRFERAWSSQEAAALAAKGGET